MNELSQSEWNKFWRATGARTDGSFVFDQLARLCSEPHRHYHNARHIAECLAEFDSARELAWQPLAVEFAIWFHDAIYDPRASDNEEQSAAFAKRCLADGGLDESLGEAVVQLILATKQHDGSLHADAPLLVDVDLSILGKPAERFWEYENQIRQEYEWVPENVFNEKRVEILERFLARKSIYTTKQFADKYERQARLNLAASMQKLRTC